MGPGQARTAVDRLVAGGKLAIQLTLETADGEQLPYEFRGSAFDPSSDRQAFVP